MYDGLLDTGGHGQAIGYHEAMFPYDATLLAAVQAAPQSIPDVLQTLQTIGATCVDADGLKWFNWLYLQVTQAVEARVAAGGFTDPAWLAQLDVQFAASLFLRPQLLALRPGGAGLLASLVR